MSYSTWSHKDFCGRGRKSTEQLNPCTSHTYGYKFLRSTSNCSMISNTSFNIPKVNLDPRFVANANAVLTAFLICLPLIFLVPSCSHSASRNSSCLTPALLRKARQIWTLAAGASSLYLKDTWIRDWNASSNVLTRLVVMKRIPEKYSNCLRKTYVQNSDMIAHERKGKHLTATRALRPMS